MSQWADRERWLSPEASAEPGKWDTSRAEYQRGIMDAICDPVVHTVVVMSSAQVGKTEIVNNIVGYHIHQDPAPILVIQPTLDMAEAWSKDRLAPMLRDTPALRGKVKDARSRDSGNTLLHKTFDGGHLTIAGANSPASLASRPVRIVLADEVDRYPVSAGAEGDPVSLARKRTTTFWNRKLVLVSTPTVKGASRIEEAYLQSDRRRYWVRCPHCTVPQVLSWANVQWAEDRPDAAQYLCAAEKCGTLWNDSERWAAVAAGEWKPQGEFRGIAGFHIWEAYSSWVLAGDIATAFVEAKGNPERLRVWINTSLGETWEEEGTRPAADKLAERCEAYGPEDVPDRALALFCGCDTQDDRLEAKIIAVGQDEETWIVDYEIFPGDPAQPAVWNDFDRWRLQTRSLADGRRLKVHTTCVDSGGHHAAAVYAFCRSRFGQRVYATKGAPGQRPIWPKRASKSKTRDTVFLIGVDTAKDAIYGRLRIEAPKAEDGTLLDDPVPGLIHFPADLPADYFAQLTSEKKVTRYQLGRPYWVWDLPKGKRNEALDTMVLALAARHSVKAKLEGLAPPPTPGSPAAAQQQNNGAAPRRRVRKMRFR